MRRGGAYGQFYATSLPAVLVAALTRAGRAASTSWRDHRVLADDTLPGRLASFWVLAL